MMQRFYSIFLIPVCMLTILIASCKPSPPSPPPKPAADILVLCIGGLGGDCTRELAAAIRTNPRTLVISVAPRNAYKVDIRPILAAYPKQHRVLVLHSFAAWWCAVDLPPCDYVVLLDPVSPGGADGIRFWGSLPRPAYASQVDLFYRDQWFGFAKTARIIGQPTHIKIDADHDDLPKHPDVIRHVQTRIAAL